ncbi:MAG: F0F1 ATP synthase subunit gamma [Acidiphilium sp.]|nr:F0F1 ATP synthase subunit gamma [Acidiphilium sp.]MDD4934476.1 F0F1 ATP synthase subunit gamma [Acidiphilium sp.]
MTERLADITARIDGIRQLGTIVNAMRGIAAARARQARGQLAAVDAYAATIAASIGRVLAIRPAARPDRPPRSPRTALVVFGAEQGFVGGFSERVFDAIGPDLTTAVIFLIGTRAAAVATERGITPGWRNAMSAHTPAIPGLADRIAVALYRRIAAGAIDQLDVVFSQWQPGGGTHVERRHLFPLDLSRLPLAAEPVTPLLTLAHDTLLGALTADYLHTLLCNAALHAFAAENEARMEAMAAAHTQIDRQLATLEMTQRIVRQDEITAEIIELAAGETASQPMSPRVGE